MVKEKQPKRTVNVACIQCGRVNEYSVPFDFEVGNHKALCLICQLKEMIAPGWLAVCETRRSRT